MCDQKTVLSQSFYLRLQPDRKISISIKYNKKVNGPFIQQDELSLYRQQFNEQIQQRSMSLNRSNLLYRRCRSSSTSKRNTLQQILFYKNEYQQPKQIEQINNNQYPQTPRKNILNLQFKKETNQQINQMLNNAQNKNAFTKFKSFQIKKPQILNQTEYSNNFDNDIIIYDSPLKSKIQTEVSNIMYSSPDVNQITPPRCATAVKQIRRRYSNQLLNNVMQDKNRSFSQQNNIINKQNQNKSETINQKLESSSELEKKSERESSFNNHILKESQINQDFISYFKFFNKKFIEDNLKVSLEVSNKIQELSETQNSCSSDVMMRIELPEKSKENLQKYETQWRQHQKIQNKYFDQNQNNKKQFINSTSQKSNLSQLIYTPYDMYIIIEDFSVQYTKRAVEFFLLNSFENDRVCIIYFKENEICNTPLLSCNQSNKNYLKNLIKDNELGNTINQEQKLQIFEQLKSLIETRVQENFLTQAIWFTHGVSLKQTIQITYKYNLIDKKNRFQINIFEYADENLKSFINKLAIQSSGNYYLIPFSQINNEQIPQVAETLCQIKRIISFKCSGMVRPLTELEYAQQHFNSVKNSILPKVLILHKYGGQKVWKEDNIFQGNQIQIPFLQHNSDYKYYLRYQFQFDQQKKQNIFVGQDIPVLKVVSLCFLDQVKNSDYIFKQNSLELKFKMSYADNLTDRFEQNINESNEQIQMDQILNNLKQQKDLIEFQSKYYCVYMLSQLKNVKDINYITDQLDQILDSLQKNFLTNNQNSQYEVSKIINILQDLKSFTEQHSVHYSNIMIENVIYSFLKSKNLHYSPIN